MSCSHFAVVPWCEGSSPLSEDARQGNLVQTLPGLAGGQEETSLHLISQFPHPPSERSRSHFLCKMPQAGKNSVRTKYKKTRVSFGPVKTTVRKCSCAGAFNKLFSLQKLTFLYQPIFICHPLLIATHRHPRYHHWHFSMVLSPNQASFLSVKSPGGTKAMPHSSTEAVLRSRLASLHSAILCCVDVTLHLCILLHR